MGCAACSARGSDEIWRERAAAIVSGEPSPSPGDDAVVFLRQAISGNEILCTGTLIAPNLVATARHCVAYVTTGPFQCTVRGEPIAVADGGGTIGADVPPQSIEIYSGEVPGQVPVAAGLDIVSTRSLTS